jgi:antitoxin PrlF
MNAISKVTSQAQVSVPASIRKALGIGPGATISWQREGDRVFVQRVGAYSSLDIHQALFGANASELSQPKSNAELKSGIATYMRSRHARS